MRAEWTPGSRLSVIDLNSHFVHVIIIRTFFTLGQLHSGTISPTRNYAHLGNPCVILHID